ncbi:hypothetical protein ACIPJM_04500 [Streptomyces halstedii]|uniref:hypothetical protein n=1 Tax=Streptomyces halstedii TaxID=1944 RepID=UPI0038271269
MQLPEQHTPVGQHASDPTDRNEVRKLAHAVETALIEEMATTSYRDNTPVPAVGAALPVAQPGRPPMSQRATDASALMLAGGAATVMVGGGASLVMLASGYADPTVCAIILGGPAVLVLAVSRLVSRAKAGVEAPPPVTKNYYGTVHQDTRTITNHTRGVIANNRNQLPQ